MADRVKSGFSPEQYFDLLPYSDDVELFPISANCVTLARIEGGDAVPPGEGQPMKAMMYLGRSDGSLVLYHLPGEGVAEGRQQGIIRLPGSQYAVSEIAHTLSCYYLQNSISQKEVARTKLNVVSEFLVPWPHRGDITTGGQGV
jgi:hypothetical protein